MNTYIYMKKPKPALYSLTVLCYTCLTSEVSKDLMRNTSRHLSPVYMKWKKYYVEKNAVVKRSQTKCYLLQNSYKKISHYHLFYKMCPNVEHIKYGETNDALLSEMLVYTCVMASFDKSLMLFIQSYVHVGTAFFMHMRLSPR